MHMQYKYEFDFFQNKATKCKYTEQCTIIDRCANTSGKIAYIRHLQIMSLGVYRIFVFVSKHVSNW